ncbi:MAG: hypothetical protein JWM27_2068 [Gemmatimonadetes bacterium]|nr:hypothetical protein [Gemmatimonadota bacterium]
MPRFTVYGPAQGLYLAFLHDWRELEYSHAHSGATETDDTASGEGPPAAALAEIFADGNGEGTGDGFTVGGRSMSVGDVVHLAGSGAWLCESAGWSRIPPEFETRFPLRR